LFYFLIILFLYCILSGQSIIQRKLSLKEDGCCVIQNVIPSHEIKQLHTLCEKGDYKEVKERIMGNTSILNKIHSRLNDNYIFQDYIFIIQKSAVHTCHRDNNGDFFNEGQKHPSYTMLLYLEDMEKCLGVIPKSHTSEYSHMVNFNNALENILCKKGDIILFNANLIHVGALNKKHDNIRIQMKVTHKDDIPVLSYFQDYNKILNKDNTMPHSVLSFQQNLSCMVPYISNLTQGEIIKSVRGSDNGATISTPQKIFSYLFYGNSNFYDLPNAFN